MTFLTFHTLPISHVRENFMPNEVICIISPKNLFKKSYSQNCGACRVPKKLENSRANISEAIQLHAPKLGVVK